MPDDRQNGLKYPRTEYESRNPFFDECEVKCQTFKLVKVRKSHTCMFPDITLSYRDGAEHEIRPGEWAVCERAIVDGEWSTTYACIACMDRWIDEDQPDSDDDEDADHA